MRIGGLDTTERVVVVAEIGNNHEGDVDRAHAMVAAAADAGADAVKFQAIDPHRLVRPQEAARIEQLEGFRLSPEQFAALAGQARELGIGFACTPFDLEALAWLEPLVDAFKIASGDNDLDALVGACAITGKPVIVSMGMTGIDGARHAAGVVAAQGTEFAALHCVSAYPTPPEQASLAQIPVLAAALPDATVGYSDHTLGADACVASVACGARILEKHFTLRHDLSDFRDHQLSADPAEMADLVARVRHTETLLGSARRGMFEGEAAVAAAARRSIVAASDLPVGHVIAEGDLWWLRPGDGMAPGREHELLGGTLVRDVRRGGVLEPGDVT
jgi:sialic acid synthase SpsE